MSMVAVPTEYFLILATFVFMCGVMGFLFRRNLIMVMMGIELMLNAANLAFVAASRHVGGLDGQIMVVFITTIAACEAAVGLAMVIAIYRRLGTVDTDALRMLRG
jgi:NADH-quinone oxidoreductase subunit K